MIRAIFALLLFTSPILAQPFTPYPPKWQDEGSTIGYPRFVNCVGSGVACTLSAGTLTLSISGASTGNWTFSGNDASVASGTMGLKVGAVTWLNSTTSLASIDSNVELDVNQLRPLTDNQGSVGTSGKAFASARLYTTITQVIYGHSDGAAASIAAGAGAGGSPTIAVAGTGISGLITLTAGSSPGTNGTILTVTLPDPFGSTLRCVIVPANAATSNLAATIWFYNSANNTATTFRLDSGAVGLTGGIAYRWEYSCSH